MRASAIGHRLWDLALRLACRRAAKPFEGSADPLRQKMHAALAAAAGLAPLSAAEARWLDRIAVLRRDLAGSDTRLTVHGANRKVGDIARGDSISPVAARLLFALIRSFRPACAIEVGTSLGLSAAVQGAALSLNGTGRLTTIECEPPLAAHAEEMLGGLGLAPAHVRISVGDAGMVLPGALAEADALGGVGFSFIDADHTGARAIAMFERLAPHLAGPAVIVLDDIRYSPSMLRAWKSLRETTRPAIAVDLFRLGILVIA